MSGIMVGFFEEIGWTGFAIPTLRRHYGVLATGLIVGLVEGTWHLPVVYWTSSGAVGSRPPVLYLAAVLYTWIPAYRLLMVCVYDHTESLFVAILMHTSLIALWYILTPQILTGMQFVAYYLTFAVLVYLVVAVVSWLQTHPGQGKAGLPVQT